MKNISTFRALQTLVISATALGVFNVQAQYSADIRTTGSDPDMLGVANVGPRIFNDAGFSVRQAAGSVVWFVASTDSTFEIFEGGGLGGDDTLVFASYLGADGSNGDLGIGGGYFLRDTFAAGNPLAGIPNAVAPQNIGVFAFNSILGSPTDANAAAFSPMAGQTYGFLNLGVNAPPQVGNAEWFIDQNIWTGANSIVPVPEPSTYALLALGGLGAFAYRRFRRE